MIIEAKANREPAQPADPRKRYELSAERASKLPLFIALMITAVAAFVKSAIPALSQGGADPAQPGNNASSGNLEAPRDGRAATGGPGVDNTTTGSIDDDEAENTIGHTVTWPHGFVLPDAVAINYTAAFDFFGPQVAAFFPAAFGYSPENDNVAAARPLRPVTPPSVIAGNSQAASPIGPGANDVIDDSDQDADEDDDTDSDTDTDAAPGPSNRGPIVLGPVRLNDVFAGQVVLIGLSQLLFGATDPDGDALSINDITLTGGTLVQLGSGWSFATTAGMLGSVVFTYNISDGLVEVVQTAMLNIVRNTVRLTPNDDVFVGTPYDDDIDALAGDDVIDARAGNDIVVGGLGDDHIFGGDGDDELFGGIGNDIIFGGAGDDIIGGGDGSDRLFGDEGNDVIDGDAGDDFIMGGTGDDILDGGEGKDSVDGEDGDDIIFGQAGNDMLMGGAGDDIINGGDGDDDLSGGEGTDILVAGLGDDAAAGGAGDDSIEGNAGDDLLDGGVGNDTLDGGEDNDELFGGEGDDTLLGGAGDDALHGEAGDDTFAGDAGDDEIYGGAGYDTLDYGKSYAALYVDAANGLADGEDIGSDTFEGIEHINGGDGDDTFVIGATATIISGGKGEDLFIFTVTDNDPTLSHQLVQQILDFVVGDRIHVADYEISHRAEQLEEQRFEELYQALDEGFEADMPIRVRHAFYDDMDHTIIEADVDHNDFYELAIVLDGVTVPLTIGNQFA